MRDRRSHHSMLKAKSMLIPRKWLSNLIILAIAAVPLMAANNDAKTANAANTSSAAASANPDPNSSPNPSPNPSPSVSLATTTGDANVAALLGVLVKKGILAPSEANSIRNAAPGAEFQLLIEALSRKGILSAADLSAATQPSAVVAAPVAASEAVSSSLPSPEPAPASQASAAPMAPPPPPAAPPVIAAVAPVRVFPVDPPKTGGLNGIKVGPLTVAPYGFIKATVVHDSSDPDGDDFPFPR